MKNKPHATVKMASKKKSARGQSSDLTDEFVHQMSSRDRYSNPASRHSNPMSVEVLYASGVEKMNSRDKIAAENKLKREQEEQLACTFHPTINMLSRKKSMPE